MGEHPTRDGAPPGGAAAPDAGARAAELEARLRAVLDHAVDGAVVSIDPLGRITGWDAGARALLGWVDAEVTNREWAVVFTPEDRAAGVPAAELAQAGARGRAANERWHQRRDGSRFWGSGLVVPLRAAGELRGFIAVLRDRTRERLAEEARRGHEARLRALTETIPQLAWESRPEGRWTWVSERWATFTGQSRPDSLGFGWFDAVHPDDWARTRDAWHHAAEHGQFAAEHRLRRADGAWRWFRTEALPIRDATGRMTHWFGISTDVHDLRSAEEALDGREAELRRLDREPGDDARGAAAASRHRRRLAAIGRLTGGVALDFDALFAAMTATLDLLAERARSLGDGQTLDLAESARDAARRGARLAARLVAFSRARDDDPASASAPPPPSAPPRA